MNDTTNAPRPYSTETVWDGGLSCTGLSANGDVLTVGYDSGWAPEQLLLLGAEGSFMKSFLAAARRSKLQVLGYVSSGHLEAPENGSGPRIVLRPCVVVGSASDADRAVQISKHATRQSIVGQLLGDQLQVSVDVQLELSA